MTAPTFGVMHDFSQRLPLATPTAPYYAECLDHVVAAERAGFDAVWMSEHHGRADGFAPSPLVAAAAIASRTTRIRIGTNVVLLPLHHPIQVAEDGAVVHAFSGGRLLLGLGQGYSAHEFGLFGAARQGRTERFEEGIEIIRHAWRDGRTRYRGKHFDLPDGPFSPQPPADAKIYVGAVAPAAVDRAVRLADGLLVYVTAEEDLYGRYETYKSALDQAGREKGTFPFVWTSVAHVAASAEEAWAEAGPALAYLEDQLRLARGEEKPITAADLEREAFLVGSPAEVAARLRAIRERAPFDHFAFWGRLPGITAEQATRATELFAAEVIPAVRRD